MKEAVEQELRMRCVDYATRVVVGPNMLKVENGQENRQEDVVEVAKRIYSFVKSEGVVQD